MNNIRLILMMLCCFLSLSTFSQVTHKEEKAEINKIKKSNAYLYAESTLEDVDEAMALAEELLYEQINQYVASKKTGNNTKVAAINKKYEIDKVTLPRGNMYRAFLYIKKSDIILAESVQVIPIEKNNSNNNSKTNNNASYTKEVSTTPDIEREFIDTLIGLQKFNELSTVLPRLKQQGIITEYAKYADLKNPDEYYLIIYNREGDIESVLSEGPNRYNIITGQDDSVANYKGRGAIGVKTSKKE